MASTSIFVNLPVKDLDRSVAFFTKLGYSFNPQFTDKNATCMVVSDQIFVMLLVEPFFQSFLAKTKVSDAKSATEVLLAFSADSRAAVDRMMEKALAAGAHSQRDPQDLGFMYSRSFADPDGHIWEHFWMDPKHQVQHVGS